MMKTLTRARVLFAAACMLGTGGVAEAAPIQTGSILNFTGQSACTTTSCTFANVVVSSGTGSFSSFALNTPATFFPFTYNPFTPQQVYTTTNGVGQTASFFVTSQLARTVNTVGGLTSFSVTDAGISRLTGFDDTAGTFLLTANQDGVLLGSFSATANAIGAVPEPATWAMMIVGFGLAGAAIRRRRNVTTRIAYAR